MRVKAFLVGCSSLFLIVHQSFAQNSGPVVVERRDPSGPRVDINPNPLLDVFRYTSAQAISVDVSTWNPSDFLHIYNENDAATPGNNVGAVTVTGAIAGSGRLGILVGDANATFLPSSPATLIPQGAFDFAGLSFGSATMRNRADTSISIAGSLTGDAHSGVFFRVDCREDIVGNVTAHEDIGSFLSIYELRAGNAIEGTITAVGEGISKIVVGPSVTAEGIQGDILAEGTNAHILQVFTSGPIGSATKAAVKIYAGNGIGEIRAVSEDSITGLLAVVAADFKADIQSNRGMQQDPTFQNFYAGPDSDGTLGLLETGGDVEGAIKAGNITRAFAAAKDGIWVRGIVDAPIDVMFNLETSNIVATAFLAPITIGRSARGAIVATGDGATLGVIDEISIGLAEAVPPAYDDEAPGMSGIAWSFDSCHPVDTLDPAVWFAEQPPVGACTQSGAWDGAVRARDWIGSANVVMMRATGKELVPRIEAPAMGELQIDDLREGVVWSGVLDFDDQEEVLENDYSHIADLVIGCMGPRSDVWVRDYSGFKVLGDVLGEIHAFEIGQDDLLPIKGGLAEWPALVGYRIGSAPVPIDELLCGDGHYELLEEELGDAYVEDSPRDPIWPGERTRERGAIRLYVPELSGQIIINAENLEAGWEGPVIIEDRTPFDSTHVDQITLDPQATDPAVEAPHYGIESEDLGGGAVGLVPYHMHGLDSEPPYDGATPEERFSSDFSHTSNDPSHYFDIEIEHYGPIIAGTPAFRVDMFEGSEWHEIPYDMFLVEDHFDNAAVGERTLRVSLPEGMFKGLLRFQSLNVYGVLPFVPIAPWEYQLYLIPDCNSNRIDDTTEPDSDGDGIIDDCELTDPCACNVHMDDIVNVFDLLDYLDCWFETAPCAEWDDVAGINVFDLLAFLDCWFPASTSMNAC